MGIGPADAIKKLCANTGVQLKDVDLIDVSTLLLIFYIYCFKKKEKIVT